MSSTVCPSREQLVDYVQGRLPEEAIDSISDHIENCAACLAMLDKIDDGRDTLVAGIRELGSRAGDEVSHADRVIRQAVAKIEELVPYPVSETPTSSWSGKKAELRSREEPSVEDESDSMPTTNRDRLDQYQLLCKLGEGGMGAVFKAQHLKLKREVAIKVLPSYRLSRPNALERFHREMEAVGKLSHPNIVHATDADEFEGTHYLVMEYVEGSDLSRLVKNYGPLPIADACESIRQSALGLQHGHEHRMVHRDIKPSNLMLTKDAHTGRGVVKILDMGLALLNEREIAGEELTETGRLLGTPEFMAPEQIHDSHNVDIKADIYSLGCTLYHLLAGRPPFSGKSFRSSYEIIMAHVHNPVPPIRDLRPEIPGELATVLGRMLAKNPFDRYSTPAEVVKAMEPFCEGADLIGLLNQPIDDSAKREFPTDDEKESVSTKKTPDALTPQLAQAETLEVERRPRTVANEKPSRSSAVASGLVALVAVVALALTLGGAFGPMEDSNGPSLASRDSAGSAPHPDMVSATQSKTSETAPGETATASTVAAQVTAVASESVASVAERQEPIPPAPPTNPAAAPPSSAIADSASQPLVAANTDAPTNANTDSPATTTKTPADPRPDRQLRRDFRIDVETVGGATDAQGTVQLIEGTEIAFRIEVATDSYVGVWWITEDGAITQLFPNKYETDHLVLAGQKIRVPGELNYGLRATKSEKPEHFLVVATTQKWEPAEGIEVAGYTQFQNPDQKDRWRSQLDALRGVEFFEKTKAETTKPSIAEVIVPFQVRPQ